MREKNKLSLLLSALTIHTLYIVYSKCFKLYK